MPSPVPGTEEILSKYFVSLSRTPALALKDWELPWPLLFFACPVAVTHSVVTAKLDTADNATCLKKKCLVLDGRGRGAGNMGANVFASFILQVFLEHLLWVRHHSEY